MASHHSKSLYAIKECSTCGRLYTKECCSIGSLKDKILVPEPDSSPRCARCGTPVDGPSCRGCAFLRKKFDEDLLAYCVENFQNTSESSDDNTNVVNALREPCVVNQDPVRKKEKAYEDKKYTAACHYMHSSTCDDEDDYISSGNIIARYSTAITPDLPIEEPDNSLKIGDEHFDIIPATESDEVIKSSVENFVPIPSEFKGMSDDTCDVPNCDNDRFADGLACIAPIPPGIVEADFDPNDDTSSDDDSYEDIEYIDATPPNSELVSLEELKDVILRDKLSNVYLLIYKIKALNDNSTLSSFSNSDNSFSDHTEETRSGSTTTHANYSLPDYDSFLFEIEPDQKGLISIDNSNNTLLELPEFESFHFDPSFPRPPPEPPNVEICLNFESNVSVIDNFDELNDDQRGSEINFSEDDDSFTFVIRLFSHFSPTPRFLLYLAPPEMKIPFLTSAFPLRAGGLSSGWNFHML
ncbi:hypothetical protein Tco_0673037 [Tanacetum coccineum]